MIRFVLKQVEGFKIGKLKFPLKVAKGPIQSFLDSTSFPSIAVAYYWNFEPPTLIDTIAKRF